MKCKVGDTAMIINSIYPENLGKLVHVKSRAYGLAEIFGSDWIAYSLSGTLMSSEGLSQEVWCKDASLMPLRPPKITETETTDELEGVL